MEIYYDKKSKEFVTLNKDNYLNIKDVKFYQTYSYNYHHYKLYKETDLEKASESEIKLLDNLNLEVRKENDNFYKFKEKGPKGGYCDYNFRPFSFEVTITNNNILEIKMFVRNKYVGTCKKSIIEFENLYYIFKDLEVLYSYFYYKNYNPYQINFIKKIDIDFPVHDTNKEYCIAKYSQNDFYNYCSEWNYNKEFPMKIRNYEKCDYCGRKVEVIPF